MPPSRRDELIDTAMHVFYRNGFHGTGIERVLQEAGISRMTLYNHFKSKDDLIVASLRRRGETFHAQLMTFVDAQADDPVGRLLAVFDFYTRWLAAPDFNGCMFINASAEFNDTTSAIRRCTAHVKIDLLQFLQAQCREANLSDADALAEQLFMLLEGAIVTALVVEQIEVPPSERGRAASRAKQAAETLIAAAQS